MDTVLIIPLGDSRDTAVAAAGRELLALGHRVAAYPLRTYSFDGDAALGAEARGLRTELLFFAREILHDGSLARVERRTPAHVPAAPWAHALATGDADVQDVLITRGATLRASTARGSQTTRYEAVVRVTSDFERDSSAASDAARVAGFPGDAVCAGIAEARSALPASGRKRI